MPKPLLTHLGSVGVGSSLEVDDAVGICGALLGVLVHGPLLQLGHLILTQFHIRVFHGQAGGEARMLPDQPPAAAPVDTRPGKLSSPCARNLTARLAILILYSIPY